MIFQRAESIHAVPYIWKTFFKCQKLGILQRLKNFLQVLANFAWNFLNISLILSQIFFKNWKLKCALLSQILSNLKKIVIMCWSGFNFSKTFSEILKRKLKNWGILFSTLGTHWLFWWWYRYINFEFIWRHKTIIIFETWKPCY